MKVRKYTYEHGYYIYGVATHTVFFTNRDYLPRTFIKNKENKKLGRLFGTSDSYYLYIILNNLSNKLSFNTENFVSVNVPKRKYVKTAAAIERFWGGGETYKSFLENYPHQAMLARIKKKITPEEFGYYLVADHLLMIDGKFRNPTQMYQTTLEQVLSYQKNFPEGVLPSLEELSNYRYVLDIASEINKNHIVENSSVIWDIVNRYKDERLDELFNTFKFYDELKKALTFEEVIELISKSETTTVAELIKYVKETPLDWLLMMYKKDEDPS